VVWRDFRTFTGVFTGPDSVEDDIDRQRLDRATFPERSESTAFRFSAGDGKYGSTILDLPDLSFNFDQYADEIERTTIDRSWQARESLPWRVGAQV